MPGPTSFAKVMPEMQPLRASDQKKESTFGKAHYSEMDPIPTALVPDLYGSQ